MTDSVLIGLVCEILLVVYIVYQGKKKGDEFWLIKYSPFSKNSRLNPTVRIILLLIGAVATAISLYASIVSRRGQ